MWPPSEPRPRPHKRQGLESGSSPSRYRRDYRGPQKGGLVGVWARARSGSSGLPATRGMSSRCSQKGTCWALLAPGADPCRERSGQPRAPAPTTGGVHAPRVGDRQPGGVGWMTQRPESQSCLRPLVARPWAGSLTSLSLFLPPKPPETRQYPLGRVAARNNCNDAQKAAW